MKNGKLIIGILSFVLAVIVAVIAYDALSENYMNKTMYEESGSETENSYDTEQKKTAPDFEVYDAQGNAVRLSDFKGKPVVVNFWATWCGPCKSELPHFEKLMEEYSGVEFMMVNLTDGSRDTVDSVKAFIKDNGYVFNTYFDTSSGAAIAYNVYSIPFTIFVDKDGNLISDYTGAMTEEILRKNIEKLI